MSVNFVEKWLIADRTMPDGDKNEAVHHAGHLCWLAVADRLNLSTLPSPGNIPRTTLFFKRSIAY